MTAGSLERLLRWYPAAWRERYGDELVALMTDDLDGREPGSRYRLKVMGAGLFQRARYAGVVGTGTGALERRRASSLIVLAAWSGAVLAGASFAKASEHFSNALLPKSRLLPQLDYDVVVVLGIVGTLLVITGALITLPAFVDFLREGGWREVRLRVYVAASLSAVTLAGLGGLVAWAHGLGVIQRNGGDTAYSEAFLAWVLVGAVSLAAWTVVAVTCARRVALTPAAATIESRLAVALAAVMAALTVATVLWWVAMATMAPRYLQWSPAGSNHYVFDLQVVLTLGVFFGAALVSGYGAVRILTPHRSLDGGGSASVH